MTAAARLKPTPANPNLERLGDIVEAVLTRLRAPGVTMGWDPAQLSWPETKALVQSIETDEGWLLYAAWRDEDWEKLVLYLDAPQLFVRSYAAGFDVFPGTHRLSLTLGVAVSDAKRARRKRLGREVPPYTEAALTDMRERQWFQWGRP